MGKVRKTAAHVLAAETVDADRNRCTERKLTEIDLKNIYVRNVRIIGSTLRSRTPAFKADLIAELVKNVWPMVEDGMIPSSIHGIYPIIEADAAQQIMQRGGHRGKLVLRVR